MAQREASESPSAGRASGKKQNLVHQDANAATGSPRLGAAGKEKGRLYRSTSDFEHSSDRIEQPSSPKPRLPRTLSSGPQDGLSRFARSQSPSPPEKSPSYKDDTTSPTTSAPGTPLTQSGGVPASGSKTELRKSGAMKRLSQVCCVYGVLWYAMHSHKMCS